MQNRDFLFLQGPVGPFFSELSKKLSSSGASCTSINFNGGDKFFNRSVKAIDYTNTLSKWPEYLNFIINSNNITDIVLYGDCREIHKSAVKLAKQKNIKLHIFEEGYIRPHWISCENSGVNANSDLPRDAEFYRSYNRLNSSSSLNSHTSFKHTTFFMGINTIFYYYAYRFYSKKLFKKYKHHAISNYSSLGKKFTIRFLNFPLRRLIVRIQMIKFINKKFYLVPLQLDRDSQLTSHSDFKDSKEFCSQVINSFKDFADKKDLLVFKNHPLDSCERKIGSYIKELAKQNSIENRVIFLNAGKLPKLLSNTKGVITINSTSGISAIHHHCKTITLGRAIYDIEGLTFQGSLDEFWQSDNIPDESLYQNFRNYLLDNKQINGGFYCAKGRKLAVDNFFIKINQSAKIIKGNFSQKRLG